MLISRRDTLIGLAASGMGLVLPAWAGSHLVSGSGFGGQWRLVVADGPMAKHAKFAMDAVIDDITNKMSPYKASSEISQFNAAQTVQWLEFSEAVCLVTKEALRIASVSEGAFDPTVGPIVSRFGFGPIKGDIGQYNEVAVAGHAIRKRVPGLTLDLCGIAKGYALDRISSSLLELGISDALVEIGGEVRALGQHPSGRPWNVEIADPFSNSERVYRVVQPGEYTIATSGHSANGVLKPAKISHIVDPCAERPAPMSLASVSVLAETGMEADALATALCAKGAKVGIDLAERLGLSALFITDGSEAPVEVFTGGFKAHIEA